MASGQPIARLFVRLGIDKAEFDAGARDVQRGTEGLKNSLGDAAGGADLLSNALKGLSVMGLAAMAKEAVGAAWELGELGARSLDVTRNLEAFAGGAEQAARFTDAVADASGNTVDRMQAAATATRFLQMGIADTTTEMALYVEGATRLGDQTKTAGQRVDEMSQLLKNLQTDMLDNFGLSKQVVAARTEELQAVQGLTREEGMLIAIQEEISRQLGVLGERSVEGALSIDQMNTSVANLKLSLGEGLAEPVTEGAGALFTLSEALQGNLDPMLANVRAALEMGDSLDFSQKAAYRWVESLIVAKQVQDQAVQSGDGWLATYQYIPGVAQDVGLAIQELGVAVENTGYAMEQAMMDAYQYDATLTELQKTLQGVARDMGAVTSQEAGAGLSGAGRQVQSRLMAVAGVADEATVRELHNRYLAQLQSLYAQTGSLTEIELAYRQQQILLALQAEVDAFRDAATEESRILTSMSSGYRATAPVARERKRTPTSVTWADLQATWAGTYEDKWDEDARRADALALRGRGELDAHPEWVDALKIPEDVLQGSEEQLQAWAAQLAEKVRGQSLMEVLLGGKAGGEGATDTVGQDLAGDVSQGFVAAIGDMAVAMQLVARIDEDRAKNTGELNSAGYRVWKAVEPGIMKALKETPWVKIFARHLAPYVRDELDKL